MVEKSGVWTRHAQSWSSVGLPQRPSPEDIAILFELVDEACSHQLTGCLPQGDRTEYRACVLGVTPELVQGPWPPASSIDAYDRSADMITQLWAAHPSRQSRVYQAEWHDLPVEDAHFAVIVGDGVTTQFPDCEYYLSFFREMRRIIQPGGSLILRCFLNTDIRQNEDEIVQQMKDRQARHFGALKWRIAMMLADRETAQVRVHEISETFDRLFPDRSGLEAAKGWTQVEINTVDTYRNMETIYTFPTLSDLARMCAPHFKIRSVRHGSYELADRCAILALSATG